MSRIYEVFGSDAHGMTLALLTAASVADSIPAGASIALKPNLVVADDPARGATTHPGVLYGCIEYFQSHGFRDLSIIESSWVGEGTLSAMKVCGYDRISREYGVPFYDLKKDKTHRVETPLRPMEIACRALDADYLIDLPVLKGHCQTRMTCALKNLKGCIPDREKRRFHTEGLTQPIAALGAALKPSLVIVDSICGDLNFEEGGNPVHTNRMFLGTDPVQIDAYGCRLMGLDIRDVPYIQLAERYGAGSSEICEEDIVAINSPRDAAAYPPASGLVKSLTKSVRAGSACSACFAALVRGLYIAREAGIRTNAPISIGQDFRGKSIPGVGIGNCCRGAEHCCPGCPPTAADVESLLRTLA